MSHDDVFAPNPQTSSIITVSYADIQYPHASRKVVETPCSDW